MTPPLVSILLPFFNAAPTLGAAVDSLRGQTCPDWELLLVDDGSTDFSPRIAAALAAGDRRVRVLTPGRVGLVEALRLGCREARGIYLARMDADDFSHPERLERQLHLFQLDRSLALCGTHVRDVPMCGETAVGEGRRRYSQWLNAIGDPAQLERELFVECPLAHPTFMMKRDALEQVGGYRDRGWPEDYDLLLRFWRRGLGLGVVAGEPLLDWRDSPARLSRTDGRYAPPSFRRCRMHHLGRSRLLEERELLQWGAGQEGKAWLRAWPATGKRPRLVVDVDPRKIGRVIHGVPVVDPGRLPPPDGALLVVAVGAPGARALIREELNRRGWKEMRDFVCVA